jgi:hypothetical protein
MIPRGIRNNNPFNVKMSIQGWKGKKYLDNADGTFEQFDTMVNGIRCGLIILRTYIEKYKLHTIEEIIKRFAPSSENNTEAYIRAVCRDSGFDRDTILFFDLEDILPIAKAIIKHENGGLHGITNKQINEAWEAL